MSFTFGLEIVIIVQSLMYQKFKSLCQDEFRLVLFRMEKLKKRYRTQKFNLNKKRKGLFSFQKQNRYTVNLPLPDMFYKISTCILCINSHQNLKFKTI